MSEVGFKPLTPQGKFLGCESLPDFGLLCKVCGLWWDCISASPTHFDVDFFLLAQCAGFRPLVLGGPSQEEIVTYIAID